ncbi:MAG: nucleotidyl transferase AbiEii/AbiGii toxin family protein [Mycobacteriales bacterium]
MNGVETALRQAVADLHSIGAPWALVGGLAVSVRTEPRFTADVDVAVGVADDTTAEACVLSLRSAGYQLTATVEQEAVGRLATVRLTAPNSGIDGVIVDVLFASSGIEPEIVDTAEPLEILPGLIVPVARTGYLLALKVLSRDDQSRPQDAVDLRALLEVASIDDHDVAGTAVALITQRGFHRGRNLHGELSALLRAYEGGSAGL